MPTILVVDDDSLDRELARRSLEQVSDLTIEFARDGSDALESMSERRPDLVLTDLRPPGVDGLELVQKVRDRYPLMPIILMTSHGSEQIAVRALQAGAASYVPKTRLANNLAETIEQVLEITEARRSRYEILRYIGTCATDFKIANDPALIAPLVGYFQENLERLGFGTESMRTQIVMALMESLSNAMIHGNLEVSSDLRHDSTKEYYKQIERRRQEAPYADRRVSFSATEQLDRLEYVVEDEGPGFDPTSLPDPSTPGNLERVRGRGVLLIRTFMDEVEFNLKGNRVRMVKRREEPTG